MSDFETYYSSDIIDLFTDLKLYCENNALDLLNKRDNDMGYYFFKLIFKHAVLIKLFSSIQKHSIKDFINLSLVMTYHYL